MSVFAVGQAVTVGNLQGTIAFVCTGLLEGFYQVELANGKRYIVQGKELVAA